MNYSSMITEDLRTLDMLEKSLKSTKKKNIVRFLKKLKTGECRSQEKACMKLNMSVRSGQRIWCDYKRNGLEALLKDTVSRRSRLSSAQLEALCMFVKENKIETLSEIKDHILHTYNINYTIVGIHNLCRKLNIKRLTLWTIDKK